MNKEKRYTMISPALGRSYDNNEIIDLLKSSNLDLFKQNYYNNENELLEYIVSQLIDSKVIGFFQGPFEWGPRALGNRSIIVDPRIKDMKDLLNKKIKKRHVYM